MSTVSKYWDKYRERHRGDSVEKADVNKLMTDKQAYISFLEVQLERVTQSVLTTQGFSDRIESLQTQLNSSDDKIINLTRLIKLQQTYAESQEEEINGLKKAIDGGLDHRTTPGSLQGLEKKIRMLEERIESARSREDGSKYEEFVKDVESALRTTELKITGLLSKVSEEMESKQKKYQKTIESSLEQCANEFNENYKDLAKKIAKIREDKEIDGKVGKLNSKITEMEGRSNSRGRVEFVEYDRELSSTERLDICEKGLKDLEQFLVAIAEEVKKIEEKQLDTSDIEYRISEKLNSKIEKLSDLVRRTLNGRDKENYREREKEKEVRSSKPVHLTPDKREELAHTKESPKFPNVFSSKSYQEDPKPRSRSKDSDASNSRERTSKSPKSVTSRSKKSNSSSRTPKSKKSNSSSRTPKSKKSVSPNATPTRKGEIVSLSGTPKATTKSKAMEASIKQKIREMKIKDTEEKKILLKKEEKKKTKKKSTEKRSKLDKLYQELSGKS